MIVYRSQSEEIETDLALRQIEAELAEIARAAAPSYDRSVSLLIDAGELSSAVLDAINPDADDLSPAGAPWMALVTTLAEATDAAWLGRPAQYGAALAAAGRALVHGASVERPRHVTRRVSEGFAYYALGPELYADAVRNWDAVSEGDHVVCLGLRTIGVTLAAAAAAALRSRGVDTTVLTLRPRGDPFERRIVLSSRLQHALSSLTRPSFLVVDEGPGLSGSSMAAVADCLSALGVEDHRIVLMPGHQPDCAALLSARARTRWARHRVLTPDFEGVWIRSGRLASAFGGGELTDLAAGAWRPRCAKAVSVAVHPQHERRKYRVRQGDQTHWIKFAGLGRYGRTTLTRARSAAEREWGPPLIAFAHGWIQMPALSGCVLKVGVDEVSAEHLARYAQFIQQSWSTDRADGWEALYEMAVHNARALCGDRAGKQLERRMPAVEPRPARIDGRHFPHEWIRTASGALIKTDGVDHHDDHFFPGPVDIAWDIAGIAEEWRMPRDKERAFLNHYVALSGDSGIHGRLPFYRAAYLAFRGGYASFAARQLETTDDGVRFRHELAWYQRRLQQVLNA